MSVPRQQKRNVYWSDVSSCRHLIRYPRLWNTVPMTIPAVYFFTRSDKQSTTLLCREQTVSDGFTGFECDQGTKFTVMQYLRGMVS